MREKRTEIKMNFLSAVCLRRFGAGIWVREVWEKEGERPDNLPENAQKQRVPGMSDPQAVYTGMRPQSSLPLQGSPTTPWGASPHLAIPRSVVSKSLLCFSPLL